MAIVDFIVELPVANPIRFTLDSLPSNERASFDQRSYSDTKNASNDVKDFPQIFEKTDPLRPQFYTNFPLSRMRVLATERKVGATMVPTLAIDYKNKKYRSECMFASINGKLFIYFVEGLEYDDEDFLVPGDLVTLVGRLPNINAIPGNILRFRIQDGEFQTSTINSIVWSPALQAQGFLTDIEYTLISPVTGVVEVTYDEKLANLFQQFIDLSVLAEGIYFVKLEFGVNAYDVTFTSEPIDLATTHENSLSILYRHIGTFDSDDMWGYNYQGDWYNLLRLPMDFYKFIPSGEIDADVNDTGIPLMLRAIPYRELIFEAYNIPSWIGDKLQMVFSHDTKKINDYHWVNENFGTFEMIEGADLGTYKVNLRQKDDRTKHVNRFTSDLFASFTPDEHLDMNFDPLVVNALFGTNSGKVFHFVSVPSWITPSLLNFSDGQSIDFTIVANATSFQRTAVLIAVCDIPGLTAQITLHQLFDIVGIPLYINVSMNPVGLSGSAAQNQLLNVSSSGDYDIIIGGIHSFTAVKEAGFTQLRISEPTENNGPDVRTGNVRLELIADPSVFVVIDVIQQIRQGLFSITPGSPLLFAEAGGTQQRDVNAAADCQWQLSTDQPIWVIIDTSLKIGVQTMNIFVASRNFYEPPRSAIVLVTNVQNPSETLTINIQQN